MAFMAVLACLVAIVTPSLCDTRGKRELRNYGRTRPFIGYTDDLVRGIGGPRLPGIGCPHGFIVSGVDQFGEPICVPVGAGVIGGVGGGIVGGLAGGIVGGVGGGIVPGIGFDGYDDFGHPIGVGGGLVGGSGLVGAGLGKGIFRRCGILRPSCRATKFDRFSQPKYTFDHRRNRCVKIFVCRSCAFINGRDVNLFNSISYCRRACGAGGRLGY